MISFASFLGAHALVNSPAMDLNLQLDRADEEGGEDTLGRLLDEDEEAGYEITPKS